MAVRNIIKEIRLERGIKQLAMAAALQVTRQTMSAIENGKYNPSLELALKISNFLNLSVEEIFFLEGDMND
ncbi:MAG: helix-turn-helix transcriptional regulator [Tissierellia bacterium]|nr:helix-turn-helix transcriptional regulator [Tissierellia bacterium]